MPKIRFSHVHAWRILQLIYQKNRISRPEVVEQTGYSAFLISKTCESLLSSGFVTEVGAGSSTGGRRPTLLSVTEGLGRIIGVHVGAVNVRIVLTDVTGNVLDFAKGPSRADEGPDIAIPHVISLIDELLAKNAVAREDLRGIGAGVSGVLDRERGVTLFWPKLPAWIDVPIKKLLQEHFKTHVEVEDTPRTMAFAEHMLGAASSARQFVYLALGAGTGAALFINGQLYTGAGGFAGEFGHVTIVENGPLCSCGNRGCLETLVSASMLIRRAQEALALGLSNSLAQLSGNDVQALSVEMIAQAARSGDKFARRLLSETGGYLGTAIVGLINLLNPELIVIGGALASAVGDLLLPEIQRVIQDRGLTQAVNQVRLHLSTVSDVDWARGAALLVSERALEQMFLESLKSRRAGNKQRQASRVPIAVTVE